MSRPTSNRLNPGLQGLGAVSSGGIRLCPLPAPTSPQSGQSILTAKSNPQSAQTAQSLVPGYTEGAQKIEVSGGFLNPFGMPTAMRHFERIWRAEANQAWFDPARAPNSPTQFEIGNVTVKAGEAIIFTNFSFRPFAFSSKAPGDWIPMADEEFQHSLSYRFSINGQAPGDLIYQLDAVPSTLDRTRFLAQNANNSLTQRPSYTTSDFARTAATGFGGAAGYGTGLLPQRPIRFGSNEVARPWTLFAIESDQVTLQGIIFRRLQIPIPCVEARLVGYKTSTEVFKNLLLDLQGTVT